MCYAGQTSLSRKHIKQTCHARRIRDVQAYQRYVSNKHVKQTTTCVRSDVSNTFTTLQTSGRMDQCSHVCWSDQKWGSWLFPEKQFSFFFIWVRISAEKKGVNSRLRLLKPKVHRTITDAYCTYWILYFAYITHIRKTSRVLRNNSTGSQSGNMNRSSHYRYFRNMAKRVLY